MRSLVLRAGTVAGVVAVLALPATTAQAATSAGTSGSSSASTGRIVSGDALAAAVVVPVRTTAARSPVVHRRPLGAGAPGTGATPVVTP